MGDARELGDATGHRHVRLFAEPMVIVVAWTSMPLATRPASTSRLSFPPLKASRTGAPTLQRGERRDERVVEPVE